VTSSTRRRVLAASAGLAAGVGGAALLAPAWREARQPAARVDRLQVRDYGGDLEGRLRQALRAWPQVVARAKLGTVVLKPNFVEVHEGRPINTEPRFVAALAIAFRQLGAPEVVVAEGPGHHRDTESLLRRSGLDLALRDAGVPFVDLNVAPTRPVPLRSNFTGYGQLHLPRIVTDCALLVSVPKLKTHHWAGVTLSMKNLFGVVPGAVYGWPKNPLHTAGLDRSIVDLWDTLRPGFAVVDGVVGMEGDGPILGGAVASGVVFLGDNLPAVDAVAARWMGIAAERLSWLGVAGRLGGTLARSRITVAGDAVSPRPFALLSRFAHLADVP
jgi:uncharacterized protein (DUF362 family)